MTSQARRSYDAKTRLSQLVDRADRLLVAQAICEPLHLLTADAALEPYSELVRRV